VNIDLLKSPPSCLYFSDLLKRLETNYDLDQHTIDVDTERLKDLIAIDQSKVIGGRTVAEIVRRFKKKLKDPRDDYKGKSNVKIIRDFLKINVEVNELNVLHSYICIVRYILLYILNLLNFRILEITAVLMLEHFVVRRIKFIAHRLHFCFVIHLSIMDHIIFVG